MPEVQWSESFNDYEKILREAEAVYQEKGSLEDYTVSYEFDEDQEMKGARIGSYFIDKSQLHTLIDKTSEVFSNNEEVRNALYQALIKTTPDDGIRGHINRIYLDPEQKQQISKIQRLADSLRENIDLAKRVPTDQVEPANPISKQSIEWLEEELKDFDDEFLISQSKLTLRDLEDKFIGIDEKIMPALLAAQEIPPAEKEKIVRKQFHRMLEKMESGGEWPQKTNNILHIAALIGEVDLIRLLEEKLNSAEIAQNTNNENGSGLTPLFLALLKEKYEVAKKLIALGADPNQVCGRFLKSQLHYVHSAVQSNKLEKVRFFVEQETINHLAKTHEQQNILHLAAKLEDTTILEYLLNSGKCEGGLQERDIYGCAPLQTAEQAENDKAIGLLREKLGIAATHTPHDKTPKINQSRIIDNLVAYLIKKGRIASEEEAHIDPRGICNGLTFLKGLDIQKRISEGYDNTKDEFKMICELISSWNRQLDSLKDEKCVKDLSGEYQDLEELFEQWANNVIWFQHRTRHREKGNYQVGDPQDRDKQFDVVKANAKDRLVWHLTPIAISINTDQLSELLRIFSAHPGTTLEIVACDHVVCLTFLPDGKMNYYDSNLDYFVEATDSFQKIAQLIHDRIYIFSGTNTDMTTPMEGMFLKSYHIEFAGKPRLEEEPSKIPQGLLEGEPLNGFTPLHLAVLSHDREALRKLIHNKDTDFNANDKHGRTPLAWLVDMEDEDMFEFFMGEAKKAGLSNALIKKMWFDASFLSPENFEKILKKYYP